MSTVELSNELTRLGVAKISDLVSLRFPSVSISDLSTTHLASNNFPGHAYCNDMSVAAPVWSDGSHWKLFGSNTIVTTDPVPFDGTTLNLGFNTASYSEGNPLVVKALSSLMTVTRTTQGGYWDNTGLYKQASSGSPRVGFDPVTHTALGLRVDQQRTNLFVHSNDLSLMNQGGILGDANAALGLDGTMSAFLSAQNSDVGVNYTTIPSNTTIYTLSVYARPNVVGVGRLNLAGTGFFNINQLPVDNSYYDFSTGTLGSSMDSSWTVTLLPNNAVCLSKQYRNPGYANTFVNKFTNDPSFKIVYLGVQFEASVAPSVLIPTTGTAATRNADQILIPNSDWKTNPGNVVVDADPGVLVENTSSGIAVSGSGFIRSIKYREGTPIPADTRQTVNIIGMNLAAAASGSTYPGVNGTDYMWPVASNYDRYATTYGINLIRLPFRWERIQPTLNGSLDSAELALMLSNLDYAHANNQVVLLDMHNYLERVIGNTTYTISKTSTVTTAHLIDGWTKIVQAVMGHAGLFGYGLMNEPRNPDGTWGAIAQPLVNAIRAIDATTPITISGEGYSSAEGWVGNNPTFPLTGTNLIYEAHVYFDAPGSGVYSDRSEAIDPQIGVNRVTPWVTWLQQYNVQGLIGEFGCPQDMPSAMTAMGNFLTYLGTNNIPATYWAGGPWWPAGQETAIEVNNVVLGQMAVLTPHFKTITRFGPHS